MPSKCWLILLICGGIIIGYPPQLFAASAEVASSIAFAGSAGGSAQNNISFGNVTIPPAGAGIRISSLGQVYLEGAGLLQASGNQAGSIVFDSPLDQIINLFSTNYQSGQHVVPIKATCSMNGSRDSGCNKVLDIIRQNPSTIRIGMHVLIEGRLQLLSTSDPAFDLCLVYQ